MEPDRDRAKRLSQFFGEVHDLTQFQDCPMVEVNTRGNTGDTPLKVAVVRGDIALVRDLLVTGADPNVQGEDDCTPLHHAVVAGEADIVSLLLAYGASSTLRDFEGHTAVDVAQIMRHERVIRILKYHLAA